MTNFVKIHNVAEEAGVTSESSHLEIVYYIAQWINANYSDMVTAVPIEGTFNSSSASIITDLNNASSSIGNVAVKINGLNMGFIYNNASSSSSTNALRYFANDLIPSSVSNSLNSNAATGLPKANISSLRLKVIRSKYGFIMDFYRDGAYVKDCKILCYDHNGTKTGFIFTDSTLNAQTAFADYVSDYAEIGGFLKQSNYPQKTMQKLMLPGTETYCEHLYLTDYVIPKNKPYTFSGDGKTYVDIYGDPAYRGIALELEEGDNPVLYGASE